MPELRDIGFAPSSPRTARAAARRARSRRGSALLYSGVSTTVLVGFASLAVDIGRYRTAKGELQAAADAAALNAANGLSDNTYAAKAASVAADNKVDGTAITSASVTTTPGNWTNNTFTANGSPRNAVRVLIERSAAKGNKIGGVLSQGLGWAMPDVKATSTVALVNQADYEWTGLNSVKMATGPSAGVWSADATNGSAAIGKTTLQTDGSVTLTGNGTVQADLKYGTTTTIASGVTVTGTSTQTTTPTKYPTGSQVANIAGVTPVYTSSSPLYVSSSMTLSGGVYSVTDASMSNCTITFTGPATIVFSGNLTMNNAGIRAYGDLPTNLKLISSGSGSINITNLTSTLYADTYAPSSAMNFSSAGGYCGMYGRGIYKTMDTSGANASFVYDRSLTASSLARKTVVVR